MLYLQVKEKIAFLTFVVFHAENSIFSSSVDQLQALTGNIQNSFLENLKTMVEEKAQLFSRIFLEQLKDIIRTLSNM